MVFPEDLEKLYELIDEIKPAHLISEYILVSITKNKVDTRLITLTSEDQIIYPYFGGNIDINVKACLKCVEFHSEVIEIYPN